MNNNINIKYQCNYTIAYDQNFDNRFILSSGFNRDILPIVTVALRGGKKNRAGIISSLICLWDIRATNIVINRKHTRPCERIIRSNKADCITEAGPYCTTHDIKVPFYIPDFYSINIYCTAFVLIKMKLI